LNDTICSPVTAPGYSGVAVIRVSGDRAYETTLKHIDRDSFTPESHQAYLSSFVDASGQKIDQILLTFFKKGSSFTGDETVEISCHGNPLIINAITDCYLKEGCRAAERGEFSFRAFYNGKIDLVQAESIHDLVTTQVREGSETFLDQLQGQLSEKFEEIQDALIQSMAHLEASIDFTEQDIEPESLKGVEKYVLSAHEISKELMSTYDVGKSLQGGTQILILGAPNAGKSSLFNQCVQAERAIVTEIAGTTRDLVTEQRFIGNHSVLFMDSAGLRDSEDIIEKMGIQKSLDKIEQADLVLFVVDLEKPEKLDLLEIIPEEKALVVFNKMDLFDQDSIKSRVSEILKKWPEDLSYSIISSQTGAGIIDLLSSIEKKLKDLRSVIGEEIVITQARHFNHLESLNQYMSSALALISQDESPDLISQELRLGLSEVHQLLGKEYDDEVLDKIFSSFCIGK
jgi:tRNA modification GTPase